MDAPSLEWVIDKASEVCGGQNALARRIEAKGEGSRVGLNSSDFPLRTLGKILAVLRVYNPSRFARRTSFPA